MSLPTFRPAIEPSPGTSHKRTLNILEADFGDGYSQPTPNGINHIKRKVELAWGGLTYEQMEQIIDFFTRMEGTKPFYYRPFGSRHTLKWTCKQFSETADEGVWKIQATLEQSYTHEV